jgi:alpha-D-xyloside xylohydrolase
MNKINTTPFSADKEGIVWKGGRETVMVQAVLPGVIRVQAWQAPSCTEDYYTIEASHASINDNDLSIRIEKEKARLSSGDLQVAISSGGRLSFSNVQTGRLLFQEADWLPGNPTLFPKSRTYKRKNGAWSIRQLFLSHDEERFYGLGQHRNGLFNYKGAVIPLCQQNGETSIPFLLSSKMYGFVWNNPSLGEVELVKNRTSWVAEEARKIDYYVITGSDYKTIYSRYADVTGHSPQLPFWATGFWQSKLRYASQEEVLNVVDEYQKRGIPLSAIVIDYLHWTRMGDFEWDERLWPSPETMVETLRQKDVTVVASIWPAINPKSKHAEELSNKGYLVDSVKGMNLFFPFFDTNDIPPVFLQYYDATNPDARTYFWKKVKAMYYDKGIKNYWLDGCEPEIYPFDMDNLLFSLGDGKAVANLYPLCHQRGIAEALYAEGERDFVLLCRSGWLGTQRFGSALWSGDILSNWQTFADQIHVGLHVGMSGIPWWTSDIGGFMEGNIHDEGFQELLIRWFEYGIFCPLCRLHGNRDPRPENPTESGADNEVWSFGDKAYGILQKMLRIRETLRPYIYREMERTSQDGLPMMRPLFFDYPEDSACWDIGDEYLFGSQILVAPVHEKGAVGRSVYLPQNRQWMDAWTGTLYEGGVHLQVSAPLDMIPVFLSPDCDETVVKAFRE